MKRILAACLSVLLFSMACSHHREEYIYRPSRPDTVHLITPQDGESVFGIRAGLSWRPVERADTCELLIAGRTYNVLGNKAEFGPGELEPGKRYFWKIRMYSHGLLVGESEYRSFYYRASLPSPKSLRSDEESGALKISWNNVYSGHEFDQYGDERKYAIYVSSEKDFGNYDHYRTRERSFKVSVPQKGALYLKVRAVLHNISSAFSNTIKYESTDGTANVKRGQDTDGHGKKTGKKKSPSVQGPDRRLVGGNTGVGGRGNKRSPTASKGGIKPAPGPYPAQEQAPARPPAAAPAIHSSGSIYKTQGYADLNWGTVEGASGYVVSYRSKDEKVWKSIKIEGQNTSCRLPGLKKTRNGVIYYWTVQAVNESGAGAQSPAARFISITEAPAIE